MTTLRAEERERERLVRELASKRDHASRLVSLKVKKMRETQELVKTKEIIAGDLKNARRDTGNRVKDFQQLYDLVKNQRNKFVNLIQVTGRCPSLAVRDGFRLLLKAFLSV